MLLSAGAILSLSCATMHATDVSGTFANRLGNKVASICFENYDVELQFFMFVITLQIYFRCSIKRLYDCNQIL
jgi:hypothetical protein